MGSVEVISSDPVKLVRLNRPAMFCAPCSPGIRVRSTLSSVRPAASLAVKVITAADGVGGVGVGDCGPRLACRLFGKGHEAGGRKRTPH